jgi:hypothetical protein
MFGVPSRRRAAANLISWAGAIVVLLAAALSVHGQENKQDTKPDDSRRAAALAAWDRIVTVLQHPRCMNCHQDNVPRQGDERRIHIPLVVRGPKDGEEGAGEGVGAMRCRNCHNVSGNNETSGTPGGGNDTDERWRLAPLSMMWQGLSSAKLCETLQNQDLNAHMDGRKLIDHMSSPLVMWGWDPIHNPPWDPDRDQKNDPKPDPNQEPASNRTPIPMPHSEFIKLMNTWVDSGMFCPN